MNPLKKAKTKWEINFLYGAAVNKIKTAYYLCTDVNKI